MYRSLVTSKGRTAVNFTFLIRRYRRISEVFSTSAGDLGALQQIDQMHDGERNRWDPQPHTDRHCTSTRFA